MLVARFNDEICQRIYKFLIVLCKPRTVYEQEL